MIYLSMGLFRGAVFHHGGVPENSPLALMGRYQCLMGRLRKSAKSVESPQIDTFPGGGGGGRETQFHGQTILWASGRFCNLVDDRALRDMEGVSRTGLLRVLNVFLQIFRIISLSKRKRHSPLVYPYPQNTPNSDHGLSFPAPETQTMPFSSKSKVWRGLGFGPSFSLTMV